MERFERLLVDERDYGYHARDHYSYHVGNSRYRYPRYACHDSYGDWYGSTASYYSDCDYVRVLLRERPYYYDTRHWRGDRSTYYRRRYHDGGYVRPREPEHGYKDGRGGRSTTAAGVTTTRPATRSLVTRPLVRTGSEQFQQQDGQEGKQQEPRNTTRQRPTLQRRPPESEPVRRAEPPRERAEPRDRGDRSDEPRAREASPPRRDEPRVRETPRQREPQREAPAPRREEPRETPRVREQPRNDPPPSRGGSERSTPSERSVPRARPSRG
jgi:hypothetical protein